MQSRCIRCGEDLPVEWEFVTNRKFCKRCIEDDLREETKNYFRPIKETKNYFWPIDL